MDDDIPPRRSRAVAGASAMGAAALLVLSFGPSALALSPSTSVAHPARTSITASVTPAAAPVTDLRGSGVRSADDADDAR
ncbi:hypothetical protein CFK41_12005 [Brachybacterium ginsengisoli]|uniref:Uncharacterized protein n=1 Tax=Brachybacterium ginsengisoli TaxID=1331682 RepID=A0A291GYW1_9MICO|nr:hypothetical protein [Brachybacterium ginsengisoli]ATG55411.1 hypothetical protein CFK41_12005 [Brachybacterium ginsengisoli]